ncbi:MAG: arginase family protein [Anaerolineales bacterium]|jgi:arginase
MVPRFILTPYFLDQPLPGLEPLRDAEWVVNKPTLPEASTQQRMAALYKPLTELVTLVLKSGELPVSIAGDCCTSIGVLAGLQHAGIQPTLIWFDAHGDFNTWQTTPSGFLGGMPLAMLVGRGEKTIMETVGTKPLAEDKVILTDGRDLDPGEGETLAESRVIHLKKVQDLLNSELPAGPLWVHFDTDVLDPAEAPAMNYLAPGGPSTGELRAVFHFLAGTGQVVAVSLSSWNPDMDQDGTSQQVCLDLLMELALTKP